MALEVQPKIASAVGYNLGKGYNHNSVLNVYTSLQDRQECLRLCKGILVLPIALLMIVQRLVTLFQNIHARVKVHFAYLVFLWHLRPPTLAVAATMASGGTVKDRVYVLYHTCISAPRLRPLFGTSHSTQDDSQHHRPLLHLSCLYFLTYRPFTV
jgi:hypothetical protein